MTGCDLEVGDGTGGDDNREMLAGTYTIEDCIKEVKRSYPEANGIKVERPCRNTCKCYAEIKMTHRIIGSTSFQSCIFSESGNIAFYTGLTEAKNL